MIDLTGFRTGGNGNAASIIQCTGEKDAIERPKLISSTRRSSTKTSMRDFGQAAQKGSQRGRR